MAQIDLTDLDMEEVADQDFISEFTELTKLCGIYEQVPKAACRAKVFKPTKQVQIKLSTSPFPPMRFARRSKTQMSIGDGALVASDLSF